MAGELILPTNAQQGNFSSFDPKGDVISPQHPWSGAYGRLNSLPSPLEIAARPWYIAERIKWLMLRDPQVFAGYMLWKTGVLVDGMQIYSSENIKDSNGKIGKERQKKAEEIGGFGTWNLGQIRGGFHSKALQLLDSAILGHKAATQVYRDQKYGTYKGKLVLDRLRVVDNDDYRIKTDEFGVPLGLQPIGANDDEGIIALTRFAWCVFRPYDDNPLGSNLLWPVYNSWYEKQQLAPERLANMSQFGSPSMWAKAPQNLTEIKLLNKFGGEMTYPATLPNGNPHPKANKPVTVPVNVHILNALKKFEGNGSVVVLPYDSELHLLEAQGNGEVFRNYSDDKNMEIIKAMFFTTSWTESEKYGSNSKSKTSAQIGNASLIDGKKMLADMVKQSILEPLIAYNYGEEFLDLCPEVTFGNIENGALAAIYNSIAALWSTGFFDNTQRAALCRVMGLPKPDPNEQPSNPRTPTGNVLVNNSDQNTDNGNGDNGGN